MKISKRKVMYFVLMAPFFQPMSSYYSPILSELYSILYYIILLFMIIVYLNKLIIKHTMPNLMSMVLIGLQAVSIISTIYNCGDISAAWASFKCIALMGLVFEYLAIDVKLLVKTLRIHCELCIYVNLISIILYPNGSIQNYNSAYGFTEEWFLGANNFFVLWQMISIVVAVLLIEFDNQKRRSFFLIIGVLVTLAMQSSSTGLVGISLFLFLSLIPFLRKIITPKKGIFIVVILFVSIVVFNSAKYLEVLVVGILQKDMTFTGRTLIWSNAITAIMNKPFMGYGFLNSSNKVALLGITLDGNVWTGATHCHNQFLQILFVSGGIGIIFYGMACYLSLRYCFLNWNRRIAQISFYGVWSILIMGIVETLEYSPIYMVLILPYYLLSNDRCNTQIHKDC